jgi:uncharacterized protein YkwD
LNKQQIGTFIVFRGIIVRQIPTMFRLSIVSFLLFLYQLSAAQVFVGLPSGNEQIASSNASFEQEVLDLVNKERKKRGRKPLIWKKQLAFAARYHAKDMAVDNYFDHPTKDAKKHGRLRNICTVFERMDQFVQGAFFSRSENIAVGEKTPTQVMKDWMSSKGHRRNILDKDAKYIGVGFVQMNGSEWGNYWVQSFGM